MKKRKLVQSSVLRAAKRVHSLTLFTVLMLVALSFPTRTDATDDLVWFVAAEDTVAQSEPVITEPVQKMSDQAVLVHTATYQVEPTESENVEYLPLYTEADAIALAKMGWGEALVTQSDTEIAATMWCAVNRFDSGDHYYRNCKTIESIVLQRGAFDGYRVSNPVDEHLLWLAYDVLDRWNAEQYGETDVGRVLPPEYLFFHGDGRHNHFRIEYKHNGQYYNWSLESPYES